MPEPDTPQTIDLDESDPKAAPTLLVAAVGLVLLVVLVLVLEVLFYRTLEDERYRKVIEEQPQELRALRAEHEEQLSEYRWIDEKRGVAAIPIERAMRLVAEEHGGGRGKAVAAKEGGPGRSDGGRGEATR